MGRTNESKVFSRIGSVWSGIGTVYLISMILSGIEHLDLVLFCPLYGIHIREYLEHVGPSIVGRWNKEEMHWSLVGNALLHFLSSAHICLSLV